MRDDVPATKRRRVSPSQRLKVWERDKGICWRCGLPIVGHKEKWTIEHIVPLGLAGADSLDNMRCSHESCRREKDKEDIPKIAKAKRMKMANLGIKKKKRRWPCGRDGKLKKTFGGEVVER